MRGRGTRLLSVPPLAGTAADEREAAQRTLIRLRLDLHDGPMQDLTAVGLALAALQRELDALAADTSAAQRRLDEVKRQLCDVERALRAAAGGGSEFHSTRVVDLVHAEIARFEQWNTARVELAVDGDVEPATDSQRIALQRVLREALTNVARHADATDVRVELFEAGDAVCLRVADDGRGCEPGDASATRNGRRPLGLTGMRERLQLLDGTLEFESAPGGPTVVTATVKRWRPDGSRPGGEEDVGDR
jgi:signal transduction histidine kinase